ncbi:hypothetical protein O181_043134 [Austropuccinia psidii MF-1]|uniref:Uncharacterized protein n=1 Tax=Austropuccinia psidii MF-1 TaxID=1389203 RepID=A0A9Q3DHF0_9BASI|nr:hypothetical protein [Austropuccinia psidii MF-1]
MSSARSGAIYNPSSSSQKCHRHYHDRSQSFKEGQGSVDDSQSKKLIHSEAYNTFLPANRAYTATRSLSRHIQSQTEGLKQFISAQRVPYPCRSVEKLHEFLPDCENIPGPSQHLKVTQWMASIVGKEKHDAFDSRMEEKQPSTTQTSAKDSPSSQQHSNMKKQPQAQKKAKERHQPQTLISRVTESQIFSKMPWKMYFRWPEQLWNYRKRRKLY